MSAIVLAGRIQQAAPPPPPGISPWRGLQQTWEGWDGSIWDLSDPDSGVFLIAGALEGLGMPQLTNWTRSSPVVHGTQWDGFIVPGRKVFWTVAVYHDESSQEWQDRDAAFWKTMRPGTTGKWTVKGPNKSSRSLTLRFVSCPDQGTTDPAMDGWAVYGIEMFPEQPLWEGTPVRQEFEASTQDDWFGATGYGPPWHISADNQISLARLSNPGDMPTYIHWYVQGPTDSVQVGVNGGVTVADFEVPDGEVLDIDTNPRNLGATLDGVDVTDQLGAFEYRPLPAGEDIDLSLDMTGTGKIIAEFTPLYLRAT